MKIQLQIQNKMVALNFLLFFFQLKYKLHLVREKKRKLLFLKHYCHKSFNGSRFNFAELLFV